ncbi:hypothetical protein [uncultured Tenacibaculum sp.]|uniref:hypothetical protein n=1 Tax=uncultured Tenacibaculum sp. TaxID=174713 RepID=UPI002626072D|nr:hypothetical protein [uncultured Tenacibaculum sp.]
MNNNIKDSIKYITNQTNKVNGFTVPENYFEKIEQKILVDSNPALSKKHPFKTPDNYFEDLENSIINKITNIEKQPKSKVISIYKKTIQLIPTAVAACVLIFLSYTYFNFNTTNEIIDFNNITTADIEEWYENGYINTTEEDLSLAINSTNLNLEEDIITSIELNNDNIEEYLNTIENSTIFNEIE